MNLTKLFRKIYEQLTKRHTKAVKTSEEKFVNYTNIRKEYITLANKIGSITDILGLIDRLHGHQHDISDEKERLASIVEKKPQLKDVIQPLVGEGEEKKYPDYLEELYTLAERSVHLIQDHIGEIDTEDKVIKKSRQSTATNGGKKRKASEAEDLEDGKKRKLDEV